MPYPVGWINPRKGVICPRKTIFCPCDQSFEVNLASRKKYCSNICWRAVQSVMRKGMKFSDEHRENIRLSRLGTKTPQETRDKLSALQKSHPEWREKNKSSRGAMMRYGCGEPPHPSMLAFDWLCDLGYEMNQVTVPLLEGGRYLLDFAHREAKVNIEIDGPSPQRARKVRRSAR
jgi:hypothetical protein